MSDLHFSSRIDWECSTNPLMRLIADLQADGVQLLDLTQSNPTKVGFDYSKLELRECSLATSIPDYVPDSRGIEVAREAIGEYYASHDRQVSKNQIIITSSTSEAYSFIFRLFGDPGDNILIPRPCYPLFEYIAALDNLQICQYRLDRRRAWAIDFQSLEGLANNRTRAAIVVNPNNPTGSYLLPDDFRQLSEFCWQRNLPLIVDEVFLDYRLSGGDSIVGTTVGRSETLTLTLSGLSKVAGLPQMKVSWIVVSGPPAQVKRVADALELISDMYLTVATPIQLQLPWILKYRDRVQSQIQNRIKDNYELLRTELAETVATLPEIQGGWYGIIQLPGTKTDEVWCHELLTACSTRFDPGYFYDFEEDGSLVCSLLPPVDEFAEGIGRLRDHLKNKADN